jgi:long-chain acyl-CoA synthetase
MAQPDTLRLETFPQLLIHNADRFGARPESRLKKLGIWETNTWSDAYRNIQHLTAALASQGFQRGDRVVVVGDNRPRLYWAMTAVQALGGIPVPAYRDSNVDEMAYVVEHTGACMAIAQDQEQVDKLLEINDRTPRFTLIVYDDPRGLRHYDHTILRSYDSLLEIGVARILKVPDLFGAEAYRGRGSDTAIVLYTSGTTGRSKGVILTYDNLLTQARNSARFEGLDESYEILSYLPMAWVGDNIISYAQHYVVGFTINCPESRETVLSDLREIGPAYFFAPPRILEDLLTNVMIRIEDAGAIKRRLFRYFMGVAKRVGGDILDGRPVSWSDWLLHVIGDLLIYGPLRNILGMTRVKLAYTAGEAIGPDLFDFYRSVGINLKQLYGSTEASVFVTVQPNGEVRADTVGKPIPGVELRITAGGEVQFRSPGLFKEYYNNPEATAEAKTDDGWMKSGDTGFIGADGQLRIIDRANDVCRLANGAMFAPKYIENKLKFFPHIKEAGAFGHGRKNVVAFINIDPRAVGNWAARRDIAYASYQELAAHPRVYELIKGEVEQVNADLTADGTLGASQIARFLILHKELDADDGELTRTGKLRRGFIAARYGPLVEAMYVGKASASLDVEVTFEDGRKGHIAGDLAIVDAKTFPVSMPRAAGSQGTGTP